MQEKGFLRRNKMNWEDVKDSYSFREFIHGKLDSFDLEELVEFAFDDKEEAMDVFMESDYYNFEDEDYE